MYSAALAQTFSGRLVEYYTGLLTSPAGIASLVLFLVLACVALVSPASRWVWVTAAFYLTTFALQRTPYADPLSPPFSYLAATSQLLVFGLLVLLLIGAVSPTAGGRRVRPSPVLWALFLLQIVVSVRYVISGFPEKGLLGLVTFALLFVALGLGFSKWAAGEQKYVPLARAISAGAVVLIVTAIVQYVLSPGAAFVAGRLSGTTPNGGRLAYGLAVTVPFSLFLATTPLTSRAARPFYYGLLVASVLAIAASGSRGAALSTLVAAAMFFRTRLGPALGFGLLLGIGVLAVLAVASADVFVATGRLTATVDTRGEVWANLIDAFLARPLTGQDAEGAMGESTYLSVAAGLGVLGLIPLAALVLSMVATIRTCIKRRPHLGPTRELADLAVSGMSVMLCLWVFEAYLRSLLSDVMVVFYALIAVSTAVTSEVAAEPMAVELPDAELGMA